MEKAAKEKQEATQARKRLEAIEFIAICLESFAYYYYVQRRALINQEIEMFETRLCQNFEKKQDENIVMWLYLRLGISIHDAYRNIRHIHTHRKRMLEDLSAPSNFPTLIAHLT